MQFKHNNNNFFSILFSFVLRFTFPKIRNPAPRREISSQLAPSVQTHARSSFFRESRRLGGRKRETAATTCRRLHPVATSRAMEDRSNIRSLVVDSCMSVVLGVEIVLGSVKVLACGRNTPATPQTLESNVRTVRLWATGPAAYGVFGFARDGHTRERLDWSHASSSFCGKSLNLSGPQSRISAHASARMLPMVGNGP